MFGCLAEISVVGWWAISIFGVMVLVGGVIIAVLFRKYWRENDSEYRDPRHIPRYRGTYMSRTFGAPVEDWRTDAEIEADANRNRP
ncbi:TPA: hypothetical protein DCQ44_02820 [Candidatus Taylorbacteria bacterium]|nr:hypothetical protein [Candidatus Taylorbacteria bacterium]